MIHNYSEEILKYKDSFIKVILLESEIFVAKEFAKKKVERKLQEYQHKIDGDVELKRTLTGIKGEIAVEIFLKEKFIDWTIGDSRDYDKADLLPLGLSIGVKTVEFGKFPVVHKRVKRPEIITILENWNTVLICGLASVPVLKKYQDDDLIINKKLRDKGTKTGFYGFGCLQSFQSVKDLINCTWYRC
jgi:hypothetical protein